MRPTSSGAAGCSRSCGRRAEGGAVRFNEFRQTLAGIPPRTLAARLVELEEAGVLERRVLDTRPPRAEYRLTATGRRLGVLVEAMHAWAVQT